MPLVNARHSVDNSTNGLCGIATMTTLLKFPTPSPVTYESGDGRPVAETFAHLYAILTTLEVLRQYLEGQQATVLANQFLYYAPGIRTARVAPDVMVIFGVQPGGRDNFKTWEEGQVPAVIFEITSAATAKIDQGSKMDKYALLGVQEYWLFDPKGEWIAEKLRGYRLQSTEEEGEFVNSYSPIPDNVSEVLQLRLQVEESLIGFYRLDNGQKLLIPSELAAQLRTTVSQLAEERQARNEAERQAEQERQARNEAERQAEQERQRREALAERLRTLGFDPDSG